MSNGLFTGLIAEQGVVRLAAECVLLGATKQQTMRMFDHAVEGFELRRVYARVLPDADSTTRDLKVGGREPGAKIIRRLLRSERGMLAAMLEEVVRLAGGQDLHVHDAARAVWRWQLGRCHEHKIVRVDLSFAVLITGIELVMARRLRVVKCETCTGTAVVIDKVVSRCPHCSGLLENPEDVPHLADMPGDWAEAQNGADWKLYG